MSLQREKRKQLSPHLDGHPWQSGKQAVHCFSSLPSCLADKLRNLTLGAFQFQVWQGLCLSVCLLTLACTLEEVRGLKNEMSLSLLLLPPYLILRAHSCSPKTSRNREVKAIKTEKGCLGNIMVFQHDKTWKEGQECGISS